MSTTLAEPRTQTIRLTATPFLPPSSTQQPEMTMVDFRGPGSYQLPHRKPVPAPNINRRNDLRPLSKIVPDIDLPSSGQQQATSASPRSKYPRNVPQQPTPSPSSQSYPKPLPSSRRTPSQSTTSTSNTGYNIPSRTPSNVSSVLSRNASTRSGASTTPGSYVALMRKQKATVWCDRAQHEDPRIAAQHKAAKIRAVREITGAAADGRTSTSGSMGSSSGGVRSKIRHHGLPKATGYSYANMVGGGVPMRLSASEVGDEGNHFDDNDSARQLNHQRTASGWSSGDNRWLGVDQKHQRYSQGSTPTSGQGSSPNDDIPELEETPVPGDHQQGKGDYFSQESGRHGSGSSSERESNFGNVPQMEAPHARQEGKTSDELRRRGSVDERANTMGYMGTGRLFVANPDLSD